MNVTLSFKFIYLVLCKLFYIHFVLLKHFLNAHLVFSYQLLRYNCLIEFLPLYILGINM